MKKLLLSGILFLFTPALFGQVKKPWSITLNPTSLVVNGNTYTTATMVTGNLFKGFGNPERTDTLTAAQLQSYNDYTMASLNKYFSKGVMLKQGKGTDRVNNIIVYPNPDPSKRYIDYVNTRYTGNLMILGLKIDSNTTIGRVQQFMSKYDFSLSEEYKNATLTVFDKKTTGRLLKVRFGFYAETKKIESIEFNYYRTAPVKKHLMEYKEGNLYLDNILLDSAANKITRLKNLFGSPNSAFNITFRSSKGHLFKAVSYYYGDFGGMEFTENPANNSLISFKWDFLPLRKEHDLDNPLFQWLINKKPFNPEKAVDQGPSEMKSRYGFDSTFKMVSELAKATYVTAWSPGGRLTFEFSGANVWEKRVYYITYQLPEVSANTIRVEEPKPEKPGLYIKEGQVWLQQGSTKKYWNSTSPATMVFRDIIGRPTPATSKVSTYPEHGLRMWANDNGRLHSIGFYLAEQINPISKKNDAPGIFTGVVEVEGHKLSTASTLSEVLESFPRYNIKKSYTDEHHHVYDGTFMGVKLYFTFLKSNSKLIEVSVQM